MVAAPTATATIAGSATALPIHRLDTDAYNRIVASGALEEEQIELLDGLVVEMSPQGPAHAAVIRRLNRHFAAVTRWWTDVQLPLEIRPDSQPVPDLAVRDSEPPAGQHPCTALLVVEVAVTSQMIDRNVKATKYAAAQIPVYWLVDVPARTVEVWTNPRPNCYTHCEIHTAPATVPGPLEGVDELALGALFDGVDA
jgi:Uma2 family endonuclease